MTDFFPAPAAAVLPAATPPHPVLTVNDRAIADLVGASISPNTRRSYLGRWTGWMHG